VLPVYCWRRLGLRPLHVGHRGNAPRRLAQGYQVFKEGCGVVALLLLGCLALPPGCQGLGGRHGEQALQPGESAAEQPVEFTRAWEGCRSPRLCFPAAGVWLALACAQDEVSGPLGLGRCLYQQLLIVA